MRWGLLLFGGVLDIDERLLGVGDFDLDLDDNFLWTVLVSARVRVIVADFGYAFLLFIFLAYLSM